MGKLDKCIWTSVPACSNPFLDARPAMTISMEDAAVSAQLRENGVINNIQAQLRASVVQLVHKQKLQEGGCSEGIGCGHLAPHVGAQADLLAELVQEYLEYQRFQYTGSVFSCEAS